MSKGAATAREGAGERVGNHAQHLSHQEARKIVNRYDTIAVEKLNVKAMQKNHCLAKSIMRFLLPSHGDNSHKIPSTSYS